MKYDKELKYNYVYFNSNYVGKGIVDRNEYNAICLRDAEKMEGVQVVSQPLDYAPRFIRLVYLFTQRIKKFFPEKIWYPFYFKRTVSLDKPICFVVANRTLSMKYLQYLRKKYPDCKLVKIHRDLVKVDHKNPEYSEENMNKIFDLRMTYDANEGEKLGFPTFNEIESKINIKKDENYPLCDVYFAGAAKNRLNKIITAYDVLTKAGLKCDFYITNTPESERVERDGITYSDKFMPYIDMLYKSVNSRCMLDINQDGAVGYTSRFLEAVMYNKKLIVDNPTVLKSKYYNPQYIQYVESMDNIDTNFIKENCVVDYHYDDEFSPVYLIYQIDDELKKKKEIQK